jgi:hypothetical protein
MPSSSDLLERLGGFENVGSLAANDDVADRIRYRSRAASVESTRKGIFSSRSASIVVSALDDPEVSADGRRQRILAETREGRGGPCRRRAS